MLLTPFFSFKPGIPTVHGKGNKDQAVPLPQKIVSEWKAQLEEVKKCHDEELAAGSLGILLDDRLENKYPKAAKDFTCFTGD